MKQILLLILLLSILQANAQVKFEKISLDDALLKAANTGKIVFVQFTSESCQQCNEVADVAFSSKELERALGKKYIALKIDEHHPDREAFATRFNPNKIFGTYFLSGDGELVHRYPASASMHFKYIEEADKASAKMVEGKASLDELDKEWNSNPTNIAAMEANLNKRLSLGLKIDSLLDVYVRRLPADSLSSLRTLGFLATKAPTIFSFAGQIMRKDGEVFREAWFKMPQQQRAGINNQIANKSMAIAIAEKNVEKAMAVASMHANTFDRSNPRLAMRAFAHQMLNFHLGTKDTINYLKTAVRLYDDFYMTESLYQVKKNDSIARNKAMQNTPMEKVQETVSSDNSKKTVVMRQNFSYAPQTQYYTNELNRGAWLVYTSTSDRALLDKAIGWSRRGLEFYASPEAMYTLAHLLYTTGNKDEALEWISKAVKISNETKIPHKRYNEVLSKIEAGQPLR
jgi:tetratricopeptide (TPR) repeat protein